MRRHLRNVLTAVAIAMACTGNPPAAAQRDDRQRVLESAAAYLEGYERDVKSIVLEETYLQRVPTDGLRRTLRSDLVIVADEREGWIELRDVVEVDGRVLGDHADRLVSLLSTPAADALIQARRLAEESARFNLNPTHGNFQRTVNVPLTTLRFLRRSNQSRSAWQLDGTERVGGRTASVLRFEERATPRLIGSKQQFAARGAFWIDAEGTVLQSELRTPEPIASTIKVRYASHPALGLWLPTAMDERYLLRINVRATEVEGRATYSNPRQFKVETAIAVK